MFKAASSPARRASRPFVALLAVGLALAGALAGCAEDGSQPFEPTGEVSAREGAGFGSAELRAELTETLVAHPYLLGAQMIAEARAPADSAPAVDPPEPTPTLDRNSIALAETLGGAYGDGLRDEFLSRWRALTRDQLALARAARTDDAEGLRTAGERIAEDRSQIGRLLESVNENLTTKGVARELASLTSLTGDAARRIGFERGAGLEPLREAARSGSAVAEVLATATANQLSDRYRGSADSPAAALRADLAAALESHVYLVGLGLMADGRRAATDGLSLTDRNSIAIRAVIREAYGRNPGRIFLPGWRRHTDRLIDHWAATGEGDPGTAAAIRAELDAYRGRLARLVARSDSEIEVERVSELLRPYLASTLDMTGALAGEPTAAAASEAINRAASTVQPLAAELTGSVIRSNPNRFPAEDD